MGAIRPAPTIATCGGTTTRLAKRPPIMPKFDSVMVAPRSSSGGIERAAASVRSLSRRSDATLELDSLKCNWYGYRYDREQSYGECRPHHEFRRLRRRRGNDFGGNREKPPDQPGRGAEDPQAPRAGGTGCSLPRPSRRRRSPAPGISHNTRSDLQGG